MLTAIVTGVGLALAAPALRLAVVWHRSRLAPEGWLAVFFGGFALGIPLRLLSTGNGQGPNPAAFWPASIGLLSLGVGVCALAWFTRVVFRAASRPALAYAWTTMGVIATSLVALFGLRETTNQMHPLSMAMNLWTLPIFWWAFVECLASHRRMSRQAQLGLGDPLVRNRFGLWSIWTGAFCMLPTLVAATKIVLMLVTPEGEVAKAPPLLMSAIRLVAITSMTAAASALWLSFFPPQAYVARVRARVGAGADPS